MTFGPRSNTYVCCHNLLVPCKSRKLIPKQLPSNLAVRAIAAHNIICFHTLLPLRRLDIDPCLCIILTNAQDLVLKKNSSRGTFGQVLSHDGQQLIQRQGYYSLFARWVLRGQCADVLERLTHQAPRDTVRHESLFHDVVHQPCAPQLVDCRGAVEARPWIVVYVIRLF